mmetsp:Transcript_28731/g.54422  ORF Transcript_28731/g.54422 Transcript_28731/m.54422 type:complete len:348 (-) Transcript_28731:594-1637(-)
MTRRPILRPLRSALVGSNALDSSDCIGSAPFCFDIASRCRLDQVLGGQARPAQLVHNRALAEHDGTVADSGDFLKVGGHDQDRNTIRKRPVEQRIDLGFRAYIHTRRRVLANQQLALGCEPAANDDLLLVATRQRLDGQGRIIGRQTQFRPDNGGLFGLDPGRQQVQQFATNAVRVQKRIFPDREAHCDGFLGPVLGHQPDARMQRLLRVRQVRHRTVQRHSPLKRDQAKQRARDRFVPCTAQAHKAQHFVLLQVDIDLLHARYIEIAQRQNHIANGLSRLDGLACFAAYNLLHQLFGRRVGDVAHAHHGPITQHGDAVRNLENLVQSVRDIDHPDAFFAQGPDRGE